MKKYFNAIILIFCVSLLASCDYVSDPFQGGGGVDPGDTSKVMRNILIDDFTGHKCPNCPAAAEIIVQMEGLSTFENRIVSVAIHTGFFASSSSAPFDADYKTQAGEDLSNLFGPSSFPMGLVNRIDYPTNHLKGHEDWPNIATQFIDEEASVDIQATVNYSESDRTFTVNADLIHLKDISSISTNIVVLVTESHIISAQKDGTATIPDYEHNHVLRDAPNTIFGEAVDFSSVAIGDTVTYNTTGTLNSEVVPENAHLVVYIYDATTQEVIQVIQTYIKK